MNLLDPLFLSSGFSGLILIVAAIVTKIFPPKEINDLYGYRSRRSKQSQEVWDFAQAYSAEFLVWVGVYNILIGTLGVFYSLGLGWAIAISMTFLIASCGFLFWKTERELKRRFGE